MFDLEQFAADCRVALREKAAHAAVREVVARAVARRRGKVEAAGAKAICEKDALPLGHDIIHSVTNPIPRLTGALHVYGGDFFARGRKEWDPETLRE